MQPGDIAVLVRYNSQAQLVQAQLHEAGVPVVLTGKTSVFATPAAAEWQRLLEALEQPHRTTRVRRAALTCFVGLDAAGLDAAGDPFADELALRLRVWGAVLEDRGVAAMFEAVSLDQGCSRGSSDRSAASGCSPTCATSRRCCTRPRWTGSSV